MATLAVIVGGLADLESLLAAASALARKHVGYGVRAAHYGPVGVAPIVDAGTRTWGGMDDGPRRRMDRSYTLLSDT